MVNFHVSAEAPLHEPVVPPMLSAYNDTCPESVSVCFKETQIKKESNNKIAMIFITCSDQIEGTKLKAGSLGIEIGS